MAIRSMTLCLIFPLFLLYSVSRARARVPDSDTFTLVNAGEFGEYFPENGASYRLLPIGNYLFQLCFYNTTPDAFHLAMLMGNEDSDFSFLRFVWEANRYSPVAENATLSFNRDGNLVLANPGGGVVWSTDTADKGVVGLGVLENGNLLLYDKKRNIVWQSFDHPTDTLLVGQSLRLGGPAKLISAGDEEGSVGRYSLVLQPNGLEMYLNLGENKTLSYSGDKFRYRGTSPPSSVTLTFGPEEPGSSVYVVGLSNPGDVYARTFFNSTFSFMRLEYDGNIKVYTYYEKAEYASWAETFTQFSEREHLTRCSLPGFCGALGVCENEMCVACPRPQGLLGWSKDCRPPELGRSCGDEKAIGYYKVEGVEHFLGAHDAGAGAVVKKVDECRGRCSRDCSCLGFAYKKESSRCLLFPFIGTLSKVDDHRRSVYIKVAK
ncbi:hypothetical protein H6P81_001445 [Aristolochia fimbriata]|uniref:Uncharacterized protein n=1 Tax=Aristolochia fimbriata TaxID=158543 RepID=A0AAV7F710_ARIFI|nr:hypothetical protein H6P81_001445 [Aristolochia fimbriata]